MGCPTDNTNTARINPLIQEVVHTNDDYTGFLIRWIIYLGRCCPHLCFLFLSSDFHNISRDETGNLHVAICGRKQEGSVADNDLSMLGFDDGNEKSAYS